MGTVYISKLIRPYLLNACDSTLRGETKYGVSIVLVPDPLSN